MAKKPSKQGKTSTRSKAFESELERCDRVFQALPPLGTPEYVAYVRKADPKEVPPQVLARAFRQLQPNSEAANVTLTRLIGEHDQTGYLGTVWRLAEKWRAKRRRDVDVEDLVQETLVKIVTSLRTPRGAAAETLWVSYLSQQFKDAWRAIYGRRKTKMGDHLVEPTADKETGEALDPLDAVDANVGIDWHARVRDDQLPRLMDFLEGIVAEIADAQVKAVAELLITGEPVRANTLAREMGVSRYKAEQLIDSARGRIRGALLSQNELIDLDTEFLEQLA